MGSVGLLFTGLVRLAKPVSLPFRPAPPRHLTDTASPSDNDALSKLASRCRYGSRRTLVLHV